MAIKLAQGLWPLASHSRTNQFLFQYFLCFRTSDEEPLSGTRNKETTRKISWFLLPYFFELLYQIMIFILNSLEWANFICFWQISLRKQYHWTVRFNIIVNKKRKSKDFIFLFTWCRWQDLNLHGFPLAPEASASAIPPHLHMFFRDNALIPNDTKIVQHLDKKVKKKKTTD